MPPGSRLTMDLEASGARADPVEVRIADAVLRWQASDPAAPVAFELLGGISLSSVHAGDERVADGLLLGIAARWRIVTSTALEARYRFFTSEGNWYAENHLHRADLALVQALGRHLAVRAGYHYWSVFSQRNGASDVRARLGGPSLGLDVRFR